MAGEVHAFWEYHNIVTNRQMRDSQIPPRGGGGTEPTLLAKNFLNMPPHKCHQYAPTQVDLGFFVP